MRPGGTNLRDLGDLRCCSQTPHHYDAYAPAEQNIGFSELMDDLLGIIPFLRDGSDPLTLLFTTFDLDQKFQARPLLARIGGN
jgi:hypothetical protein